MFCKKKVVADNEAKLAQDLEKKRPLFEACGECGSVYSILKLSTAYYIKKQAVVACSPFRVREIDWIVTGINPSVHWISLCPECYKKHTKDSEYIKKEPEKKCKKGKQ